MPVSRLADARTVEIPGIIARPVAVPSRGTSELAVWLLEVRPGTSGQPHTVDREEIFVVRSGRVTAAIDGETHPLGPGDALIVPPDTLFSVANPGDEAAHLTVCTSKGIRATLDGQVIVPPWAE